MVKNVEVLDLPYCSYVTVGDSREIFAVVPMSTHRRDYRGRNKKVNTCFDAACCGVPFTAFERSISGLGIKIAQEDLNFNTTKTEGVYWRNKVC